MLVLISSKLKDLIAPIAINLKSISSYSEGYNVKDSTLSNKEYELSYEFII